MKNLTEEIKKDLLEYNQINAKRNQILTNLQLKFKPLVEDAYQKKDTYELVEISQTLPDCLLHQDIQKKLMDLLEHEE